MSSFSEHSTIFIPTSYIKSPGSSLQINKNSAKPLVTQSQVEELFRSFQSRFDSKLKSHEDISSARNSRKVKTMPTAANSSIFDHSEPLLSPGRLKTMSDEMSSLIPKAKEILRLYSIDLVIENVKNLKGIYSLIKTLVSEICFFPLDFFQKLQLKQIIIDHEENYKGFYSQRKMALTIHPLDTDDHIRRKLFKKILDDSIIAIPEILRKWKEIDQGTKSGTDNLLSTLEEIFIALMNNSKHPVLKPLALKLRKLLENYYPEAMSEERFAIRFKEKKKSLRVRFEDLPDKPGQLSQRTFFPSYVSTEI